MKKCIIHGVVIYLLFMMFINLQKPNCLYDEDGNIKSLNYFKFKLKYGFQNINELICLPTIAIIGGIGSFIIAKQL